MIFGNKNTFAIEADFYQNDDYIFISHCFWANNHKIGDNSQSCLLSFGLDNIKHNIDNEGFRKFSQLTNYSCKEIFTYFNYKLWGAYEEEKEMKIDNLSGNLSEIASAAVIKNYNECFDGYYCYLLEYQSYDTFIWNDDKNNIKCFKIPKGLFYKAFKDIDKWLKANTKLVLSIKSKDYYD